MNAEPSVKGYHPGYVRIGDMLIREGKITESHLQEALRRQEQRGGRLGQILVDMKAIAEEEILRTLAQQLRIPRAQIPRLANFSTELLTVVPESLASRYRVVPLKKEGDLLSVAMVDPFDIPALDDLRVATGLEIQPLIASEAEVQDAIERLYRQREGEEAALSQDLLKDILQSDVELQKKEEEKLDLDKIRIQVEDAPVVRLVDYIISNAVRERASDIHIEPREDRLDIRYRIDGILHNIISPPRNLQNAIISRIKILADMDIAERRLPQDGRFTIKLEFREVDLRVSTLPTTYGEKIVIRLLRKGPLSLNLEDLGFEPESVEVFKKYILRPYGMILLTGPTGSGKTTTLYAALNQITSSEKNIVTVEDPVEYQLKGVYQMQANPPIGLTFAAGLRAILRQDPDIIMVGEIRDYETAEMAVRAALTGHLVFSTLHTNDAVGTIVRLVNMGIEPFLVCSALSMSVAQRLVRKICPECKETVVPSSDMLAGVGLDPQDPGIRFYQGRGCPKCKGTGYFGRTGIFEILEVNQRIKDLVLQGALPETIHHVAVEQGMATLRQCAVRKVLSGVTTFAEVLRVCIEEE
ncbi:MAG: GspE/PulE family protein [Thermodesulfobacteriota bacterium]